MRLTSALPLLLLAMVAGCDTAEQQRTFRELALAPPSGFTRTDAQGTVISADPDDWRVSPVYGPASVTWVTTEPLRPNPVSIASSATLLLNVRSGAVAGGLTVVGYVERPGQLPASYVLADEPDARGFVVFDLIPSSSPAFSFGGGLRRIVVFDGQGEPVTYGDLMIE